MSNLARQQENREKGELRTQAILSDAFWILKRSVDVDGADLLVQIPAESLEELRSRQKRIEILGVVQAKYFENSNQVKIQKHYIEDSSGPRTEFFAFLHTNDSRAEKAHYFFTAEQISQEFYASEDDKYYCFSLTKDRNYDQFRNISEKKIFEIIKNGILITEARRNWELIKIVYGKISLPKYTMGKTLETPDSIYEFQQQGEWFEITQTNKSTGVKAFVAKEYGSLEQYDFNPATGTVYKK